MRSDFLLSSVIFVVHLKAIKILRKTTNLWAIEYYFFVQFDCFSCGPCWVWYVWRRNDKTAHQITKTCMSYEQCYSCCRAWCSTWCFFNVRCMMNDPLNSCKRPIKFIFYPLLFERPCELDDFLFVPCSVFVWLLFHLSLWFLLLSRRLHCRF